MTDTERIEKLNPPSYIADAVLDTDAYNEIDDQYAIAYMLKSPDRVNLKAIYAAPFSNPKSGYNAGKGMELSYNEIEKILAITEDKLPVFRGSESFLKDEKTPVISDAASDLAKRAMKYSKEKPLYVVAIGAITNIASAILINPEITERIVVIWLGGHARHFADTKEFNMFQDIASARVVMGSGAPFVQLPCMGVVSEFRLSHGEIEKWLLGKTALSDYLGMTAVNEAESYASGRPWTRIIWDVCAVAWLFNGEGRFMRSRNERILLPSYEGYYESEPLPYTMKYIYSINRDELMYDLIKKITEE
jgi:inosine-uridine nucleoside N-ribohydrolase